MKTTESDPAAHFQLRYRMMVFLYRCFQTAPNAAVDIRELAEECRTTPEALNWNLAYLEKKGFVELGRSEDFPPYITAMVTITANGIDLVEDEPELKKQFRLS